MFRAGICWALVLLPPQILSQHNPSQCRAPWRLFPARVKWIWAPSLHALALISWNSTAAKMEVGKKGLPTCPLLGQEYIKIYGMFRSKTGTLLLAPSKQTQERTGKEGKEHR